MALALFVHVGQLKVKRCCGADTNIVLLLRPKCRRATWGKSEVDGNCLAVLALVTLIAALGGNFTVGRLCKVDAGEAFDGVGQSLWIFPYQGKAIQEQSVRGLGSAMRVSKPPTQSPTSISPSCVGPTGCDGDHGPLMSRGRYVEGGPVGRVEPPSL
jgi:hypothetical protein